MQLALAFVPGPTALPARMVGHHMAGHHMTAHHMMKRDPKAMQHHMTHAGGPSPAPQE